MRGLEKNRMGRGHPSQLAETDIATTRPKRPKGRFGEKMVIFPLNTIVHITLKVSIEPTPEWEVSYLMKVSRASKSVLSDKNR